MFLTQKILDSSFIHKNSLYTDQQKELPQKPTSFYNFLSSKPLYHLYPVTLCHREATSFELKLLSIVILLRTRTSRRRRQTSDVQGGEDEVPGVHGRGGGEDGVPDVHGPGGGRGEAAARLPEASSTNFLLFPTSPSSPNFLVFEMGTGMRFPVSTDEGGRQGAP